MSQVGVFRHVLFLLLMCYCVESCVQKYIQVQVPEMLEPGYVVSQVNLDDCEDGPLALISSDPDFTVHMDGTIQAVLVTMIPEDGRSFWITVHNRKGHRWFVDVILSPPGQVSSNTVLRRSKRRWSPPPFSIKENDKGPFPKQMEMIASDSSVNYSVYYTIDGPGVDKDPTNIFSLTKNGMLSVLKTVDREKNAQFKFTAYAHNSYGSQQTDDPLPITVLVEDENDNAPEFTGSMQYAVQEKCPMSKYNIQRDANVSSWTLCTVSCYQPTKVSAITLISHFTQVNLTPTVRVGALRVRIKCNDIN